MAVEKPHTELPALLSGDLTREQHYRGSDHGLGRADNPIDRRLTDVEDGFGVDFDIFEGDLMLDLGSGINARLAREAASKGIDVVSVNPNWDRSQDGVDQDGKMVAAIAQELPFADNSFDSIISYWSIPAYLPGNVPEYELAFREVRRTLKIGGIAIFAPIPVRTANNDRFREILDTTFGKDQVLLGGGGDASKCIWPPKLLVVNEEQEGQSPILDYLCLAMDRPTPLHLTAPAAMFT